MNCTNSDPVFKMFLGDAFQCIGYFRLTGMRESSVALFLLLKDLDFEIMILAWGCISAAFFFLLVKISCIQSEPILWRQKGKLAVIWRWMTGHTRHRDASSAWGHLASLWQAVKSPSLNALNILKVVGHLGVFSMHFNGAHFIGHCFYSL